MEERKKHFERPTTERPPSLFNLTLLAALFGLLAGFLGYVAAHESNVVKMDNQIGTNVNIPVVNIEQPIINIARKYQRSIAGVYQQTITNPSQPLLYNDSDYLGAAAVVTSDGWLMSTDQVIKNTTHDIILGDKIYEIQELKQDKFTGITFVKIEANSLTPIDFQLTGDLSVGEKLFTNVDLPHSAGHSYQETYLANDHYVKDKILSTDKVDYYLQLGSLSANNSLLAAPYFNVKGDVLGVLYEVDSEQVLLPSLYLKQAVKHLLDNTERVLFSVTYTDLENNSGFTRKGHLLNTVSSVGVQFGLKAGDQVVAVNNDVITTQRTLTAILQDYRPGDTVTVKISRDDIEQDVEVEL